MSIIATATETTVYNCGEFSSRVKYPDAMGETSMRGPRKDQFAETELLYPSQPLEWPCFNNLPKYMLELVLVWICAGFEFDQIMDWITNPLDFSCHGLTRRKKTRADCCLVNIFHCKISVQKAIASSCNQTRNRIMKVIITAV
jgi:hypothetical protein